MNNNFFKSDASSDKIKELHVKSVEDTYSNNIKRFVLGDNTSRILLQDPKLLLFVLSRYKFVSKMINGSSKVLEVGCQEGFGAVVVADTVGHLHGVDFFAPFISSCSERLSSYNLNLSFDNHDMLDGPVHGNFDAVFSLDVIEHIEKNTEEIFMRNIVSSLKDTTGGKVIIGTPTLESQKYASKNSKIGHVNCKTGDELINLCSKYFHNIFLFSMNDEVVHTGFLPMSHYIFAVCSEKKIKNRS